MCRLSLLFRRHRAQVVAPYSSLLCCSFFVPRWLWMSFPTQPFTERSAVGRSLLVLMRWKQNLFGVPRRLRCSRHVQSFHPRYLLRPVPPLRAGAWSIVNILLSIWIGQELMASININWRLLWEKYLPEHCSRELN